MYKFLLKGHKKHVPHSILNHPPVGRCRFAKEDDHHPFPRRFREACCRHQGAASHRNSGNRYFLPCVIWGYLLRTPERAWPEILARMLPGRVSDICVLFPFPAHRFKKGWPRDPNTGFQLFSLPTFFTEEFALPKSANLTKGLWLDWILHFR